METINRVIVYLHAHTLTIMGIMIHEHVIIHARLDSLSKEIQKSVSLFALRKTWLETLSLVITSRFFAKQVVLVYIMLTVKIKDFVLKLVLPCQPLHLDYLINVLRIAHLIHGLIRKVRIGFVHKVVLKVH